MIYANTYNIVGLDPGGHLGVGIITVDTCNLNILAITSTTINIKDITIVDNIINRLSVLRDIIINLYYNESPAAVSIEVAFMNTKYPNAVMLLSQYVSTIERTWYECNPFIHIYKYAPLYIKSKVSGTGKADKDDMRTAVSKHKELKHYVNTKSISEHEIDAISIAYTALLELRVNRYVLLSIPY